MFTMVTIPPNFVHLPHNAWSMVPALPGVYILDGEHGSYVGSTTNLYQRVSHHPKRKAIGIKSIHYRLVDESRLAEVENETIRIVQPSNNGMAISHRRERTHQDKPIRLGIFLNAADRAAIEELERRWYPNANLYRPPVSVIIRRSLEIALRVGS